MAKTDAPQRDMTSIGEVVSPAFVRLPEPLQLFCTRAARFRYLAEGHDLKPYLLFLAGIAEAQHVVQGGLPAPTLPKADALKRAREFSMPALDRARFEPDQVLDQTLERLLDQVIGIDMPEAAAEALARLRSTDGVARAEMVRSVLAYAIPMETLADHLYVAAALQVQFARLAAQLDAKSLVPVGDGACPVCGGLPATSMVVGWQGAHGARYCGCALCGTLWNYVRIKCALCGSTAGIAYEELEGGAGTIKAETCKSCHGYVKILHQHQDPAVDPIADDVASLGLDLLVRETGFTRGGANPFLVGY
ncbi:formate dehydrogenase accessory protein FdhE [Dongia deserti]|uniref:formate dehydrogenase accessory protein FdhE n=1 Tax=Dongia deserti TaxID=2268030 RepID=UPI000E65AC6B|nr:formate dehydrogenase accessory protein FdhE [Dongia deserti]